MKYYADVLYWSGNKETIEIKPEFIDDIVSAVEGQYTFIDNVSGLTIKGGDIRHIDIFSVISNQNLFNLAATMRTIIRLQQFPKFILLRRWLQIDYKIFWSL